MKNCLHCKNAKWDVTAKGRLHPSGDGRCTVVIKIPALPASMYWTTLARIPSPSGGYINRRKELNDHCSYFALEPVARMKGATKGMKDAK